MLNCQIVVDSLFENKIEPPQWELEEDQFLIGIGAVHVSFHGNSCHLCLRQTTHHSLFLKWDDVLLQSAMADTNNANHHVNQHSIHIA